MGYFVYVLLSEFDGRFYYGQTKDLLKRLEYHNKGYSTYTKKFRPWKIFAFKEVGSRSDALKLESKLKNLHSHSRLQKFLELHEFQEVIGAEK